MKMEVPIYLLKIIQHYITNRSFQVKLGHQHSRKLPIPTGVPQGSVLSPLLFNIYINDAPTHPSTELALYADDTAILANSYSLNKLLTDLQQHTKLLAAHFIKWRMSLNTSKTETVIFTRKYLVPARPSILVNNVRVSAASSCKYLGVILDRGLHFHRQDGFMRFSQMRPLLRSPLSYANKRLVYMSIIRSIITYAAPIWSTISATQMHKLEVIQNKVLRSIIWPNLPPTVRQLRAQANVPSITGYVKKLIRQFLLHGRHGSPLTSVIVLPSPTTSSARRRFKQIDYLLYN